MRTVIDVEEEPNQPPPAAQSHAEEAYPISPTDTLDNRGSEDGDPGKERPEDNRNRSHNSISLQDIMAVIGLLLTIGASTFAYCQWKKERTLDFQKDWRSREMVQSQSTILNAMICNIGDLDPYRALKDKNHKNDPWNSPEYYTPNYLEKVSSARKQYRGLNREIEESLVFFESLNSCVDSACNKELACKIFLSDATAYQRIFTPYLAKQRAIFGIDYGRDIDIFVQKCSVDIQTPLMYYNSEEQRQTIVDFAALAKDVDSHQPEIQARIDEACRRMRPGAEIK